MIQNLSLTFGEFVNMLNSRECYVCVWNTPYKTEIFKYSIFILVLKSDLGKKMTSSLSLVTFCSSDISTDSLLAALDLCYEVIERRGNNFL